MREREHNTVPMFDVEHVPVARAASQKSVRTGKCPACNAKRTGLLRNGEHLVWRQHTYETWMGTRVTCRTSGVAVCVAPERVPLKPSDPAHCTHNVDPDDEYDGAA